MGSSTNRKPQSGSASPWVLEIAPTYNARSTGILTGLKKRGWGVQALTTALCWLPANLLGAGGFFRSSSSIEGFGTVKVPVQWPRPVRLLIGSAKAVAQGLKLSRKNGRPAAVIGYNASLQAGFLAYLIARCLRVPFVLDHADLDSLGYGPKNYKYYIERLLLASADGICVVSPRWKRLIERIFRKTPRQVAVVPAATDPQLLAVRNVDPKSARQRLGIDPERHVLGYSGSSWIVRCRNGSDVDVQGVELVLEGVLRYAERHPDRVTLITAGARLPLSDEQRRRAQEAGLQLLELGKYEYCDQRHFDALSAPDVLIIGGADIAIYRYFDRFKLYEYAATGRKIVAANSKALAESGVGGLTFFKPGDAASLADAIETALEQGAPVPCADTHWMTWDARAEAVDTLLRYVVDRR